MTAAAEALPYALAQDEYEHLRAYDDASTWFAEALEGSMRTRFEYSFDGRELYGRDGRALGPIFERSIDEAERLADKQPNSLFELRRRTLERDEYEAMLAMVRGELANTMIVVSDFPAELMDAPKDIGGYDVSRRQTMLRVISRQPNGRLAMTSQSLDGSNRPALEALYNQFEQHPAEGELLGQRIHVEIDPEEQQYLTDHLTGVYDRAMAAQYGGQWYAGRPNEGRRNTYDFVCAQQDLLEAYVGMSIAYPKQAERMRYDFAAALQKRLSGLLPGGSQTFTVQQIGGGAMSRQLTLEIRRAGDEARAAGRTFSGCGATAAETSEKDSEAELKESGYGNKGSEEVYDFTKKMFCVVCQRPPKENDLPKLCGPCGICKGCDAKLRKVAA